MASDEFLGEASSRIGSLGAAFYFIPPTLAKGKELGLDGLRFYFLGRGGVLGDVEAPVVGSAFGYFNPGLVAKIWTTAKERSSQSPRDTARTYLGCNADLGRANYSKIEGLDAFNEAAAAVDAAAEPAGLALYAGISAEQRPSDAPGLAAHMVAVLRELRGSAHLLAIRACGLEPQVAHYIKRPGDMGSFGWDENNLPTVTDADRQAHVKAEEMTDALVAPAFAVLDDKGRETMLTVLRQMDAAAAS
jgi:hypothetical protein